jgi:hypothetical protein
MLVKKWLILSRGIEMELPEATAIIEACALLHNHTHHLGPILENDDDISRDGGCVLTPNFQSDCHCDAHLDVHQVVHARGSKRSTNRDVVTADLKAAGMLRSGRSVSDYAVYE